MRVTKYVHSCLLVESDGLCVLIDPGNFTRQDSNLEVSSLPPLDHLVITHSHSDHFNMDYAREVLQAFPEVAVIATAEVLERMRGEGLTLSGHASASIDVFEAGHAPLPMGLEAPPNIGVHIGGKLTHPGDAWDIPKSQEVLALPLTAPFGSLKQALECAIPLKPKKVIAIHDWHWHETARHQMYALASELLGKHGIEFVPLANGKAHDF